MVKTTYELPKFSLTYPCKPRFFETINKVPWFSMTFPGFLRNHHFLPDFPWLYKLCDLKSFAKNVTCYEYWHAQQTIFLESWENAPTSLELFPSFRISHIGSAKKKNNKKSHFNNCQILQQYIQGSDTSFATFKITKLQNYRTTKFLKKGVWSKIKVNDIYKPPTPVQWKKQTSFLWNILSRSDKWSISLCTDDSFSDTWNQELKWEVRHGVSWDLSNLWTRL